MRRAHSIHYTNILKFQHPSKPPRGLVKTRVLSQSEFFELVDLGWGLAICISNKWPGDADDALRDHNDYVVTATRCNHIKPSPA